MAVKTKELLQVCDVLNNEIPEHWKTTLVKNFSTIKNGGAFKSQFFNQTKGIPLIRIRDLTGNKPTTFYDGEFDEEYVVNSGDFLISMDGDFVGTEWTKGKALLNQRVCKLVTNNKIIHEKFFRFGINRYLKKIHSATSYLTVAHLSSDTINHIDFPIPPLNEQKRIVAKIEELFSLVDSAKDTLEKTQVLLKQYRQSILKHAFEGKLVPQDPNDESASVLLEKIKKENPDNKFSEVISEKVLPNGWIECSFQNIITNHDGKRIPVSAESRKNMKGKYPYYGASGIIDYVNKPIFNGKYLLIGEDGANLLSRSTPIAFIVEGEFWVNNHAHILTCNGGILLEYVSYYINSKNLSQWISGTAQPKLNQNNLNKIPILLAPLNEQKRIVGKIEENFSLIEKNEKIVDELLLQYKQIKNSILKQAFEGKLVPQDPNDEPAEILLQRIREEKNGK